MDGISLSVKQGWDHQRALVLNEVSPKSIVCCVCLVDSGGQVMILSPCLLEKGAGTRVESTIALASERKLRGVAEGGGVGQLLYNDN